MEYLCECGNADCRETIPVELTEMLFLRRHAGNMVVPAHVHPGDEIIGVDSETRFFYVAAEPLSADEPEREEAWQYG